MLSVCRDKEGNLEAACEWWTVDEQGRRDPNGKYVWVETLEIGQAVHGFACIYRIIRLIGDAAPQAIGAYWIRERKYANMKLHAFKRKRLIPEEVRV